MAANPEAIFWGRYQSILNYSKRGFNKNYYYHHRDYQHTLGLNEKNWALVVQSLLTIKIWYETIFSPD